MRFRHPLSTSEAWEISALVHKVSNIHNHLRDKLDACHKHIGEPDLLQFYGCDANLSYK